MLLCQREDALNALAIYSCWAGESPCFRADTGDAQNNRALHQCSSNGVTQHGSSVTGQPFLGWRLGEGASLLSLLMPMCLCWSQLQSPCSAWKEEISIRRPIPSGVPFHQASPAGSPWSHQNCHLSYSTGLVQAITHVLHTLPFLMYFPVGSAPASAFSTTNLHVHHIFALKLIIAAPQTVPEG